MDDLPSGRLRDYVYLHRCADPVSEQPVEGVVTGQFWSKLVNEISIFGDSNAGVPAGLETHKLSASLRRQAPINLSRAYEIMEEHGLDGIVVGDPVNVFHFSGYWPQIAKTKAGQPPTTFMLLSRDPKRNRGIVASKFIYYYTFADSGFSQPLDAYLYIEAGDEGSERAAAEANATVDFPDRAFFPLSRVEQRRRDVLTSAVARQFIRQDAGAALVAAMRDFGLWTGTVAFDDPVISSVCEHHERPGKLVPADNILRAIRMVKSPLEISLMRRASWGNVQSVQATARRIQKGMSYHELRTAYFQEVVIRENLPVFMTIDRVSASLADAKIAEGQAFFIDGVSHYQNYHGDYARTVFVGEPTQTMQRAAGAVALGWDAIREKLKPGLRYSELAAFGKEAVRKAGYDFIIGFGPHSVGLSHTDEPGRNAGGFYVKDDITLQENMILSVDCPVMDTGVGGSAHMEDLMVITRDGAEPLHAMADPVIIV